MTEDQPFELPKAYLAEEVESSIYQFWEKESFFEADLSSDKPPFCLTIPPPNVTGTLHMGHALGDTLQDIIVRWKRMCGFETLWVPGTDHAGIATQTVVERHLFKTEGKRRGDYQREELIEAIWGWKERSEKVILEQIKRIGCSCDWSRLRFTMDSGNNQAVRKIFKKLYDEGLIYRGHYLVNWDPVTQTAIADDEVEYEERNGSLWYFTYPLKESSETVSIATTRPETMLGDTAVAVSPEDPRYLSLIGKTICLPLSDREIPIISDAAVDPSFGTGVVKITPAHDPNDYEMGKRHSLESINIMTIDGRINENGGRFTGLSMQEARVRVVEAMETLGLLEKIEPHLHRVGISYRSKATIEPYLSKQWFIKMKGFAKDLREAVDEEEVLLTPKNWENTYFHWIDNLRDWCISRQLWWGHQIPIWYHKEDHERLICYEGEGVPEEVEREPDSWFQDPDVLDTWFSSALWPFAALGWPDSTKELEKFYPNSLMITGHDILFFWIARMIMMGKYALEKPPFPQVYLHSLIFGKSYWRVNDDQSITYVSKEEQAAYDLGESIPADVQSKWEKMSKSKGNVIDPLEMIDIYGADAVRMALASSSSFSWQIDLDRRRFEEFKNFANKIWNGSRFVLGHLQDLSSEELSSGIDKDLLKLEDRWILSALQRAILNVNGALEAFRFDEAATFAYDFFWKEFCAYYLEIAKPYLFGKLGSEKERNNKQKLLVAVLTEALLLIHPMAPFITEHLFSLLKKQFPEIKESNDPLLKAATKALQAAACMVAPYPILEGRELIDSNVEETFSLLRELIWAARNIRGEMQIPPSTPTELILISKNQEVLKNNQHILSSLIRTEKITISEKEPKLSFSSSANVRGVLLIIPMPESLKQAEKTRLVKEQEKRTVSIEKLLNQLDNKAFISGAPEAVVEKQRKLLEENQFALREIEKKLRGV